MASKEEKLSYFHLSGAMLEPGSIILPGNWGRVLNAIGWRHGSALAEQALEAARIARFPHRPSRLECAFGFITEQEARDFREKTNSFNNHLLYRVTLIDPTAASHITDSRLSFPQGTFRHDWADVYWMDVEAHAGAIPGIDWHAITSDTPLREMLTLSNLRVEERLD